MNQIIKIGLGLLLSFSLSGCQAGESNAIASIGVAQSNYTDDAVATDVLSYEYKLKQWEEKDTEYKDSIEYFTRKMTDADYEALWGDVWEEHKDIILNGMLPFKNSKDPLFRKSYEQQRQIYAERWQTQRDDWLIEKPKRPSIGE